MVVNLSIFPRIADEEIEQRASQLLADYFRQSETVEKIPVPVEVIAEHYLGYEIDILDNGIFADQNYLGGIIFDQNVIQVNASVERHEGRYSFTLAHEIGHHVLHREIYLAARDGDSCDILCRETGKKPLIEAQADQFAAALLMPEPAVRLTVGEMAERPVTSVKGLRVMAAKVIKQGGFNNVSTTAMANRLVHLGYADRAAYQTGTPADFRRGAGYKIRSYLPAPLQKLLRSLYKRYGHRLPR